jgi:hypothetical protein
VVLRNAHPRVRLAHSRLRLKQQLIRSKGGNGKCYDNIPVWDYLNPLVNVIYSEAELAFGGGGRLMGNERVIASRQERSREGRGRG